MDAVWGYAAAVDTGTVTVHIRGCGRRSRPIRRGRDDCRRSGASATASTHDRPRPHSRRGKLAVGFSSRSGSGPLPTFWSAALARGARPSAVPLAAVLLSGWVMFHMGADVKILAVASSSASAAVIAAVVLARSIAGSIRRVGRRAARSPPATSTARGPTADRRRSSSSPRRSTRWPRASSRSSTPGASWSPGRATTCGLPRPMQAMLEAIEDGLVEPEHYLPALHEQVRALSQLVDDLFELARIDRVRSPRTTASAASRPSSKAACALASRSSRPAAWASRHVGRATRPPAFAPDKIQRVLLNLLTNALRHTPTDGSVAVVEAPPSTSCSSASRTTAKVSTPEARAAHVRTLLARGPRPSSGGGGTRPRNRPRPRRGPRGPHLGGEPRGWGTSVSFTLPRLRTRKPRTSRVRAVSDFAAAQRVTGVATSFSSRRAKRVAYQSSHRSRAPPLCTPDRAERGHERGDF